LKGKLVWANWDVDELKDNAMEIESSALFTLGMDGFSSFKYKIQTVDALQPSNGA
jgi:hypothetical protein